MGGTPQTIKYTAVLDQHRHDAVSVEAGSWGWIKNAGRLGAYIIVYMSMKLAIIVSKLQFNGTDQMLCEATCQ